MILKTRLLPFQTPLNYEAQERQKYLETIPFFIGELFKRLLIIYAPIGQGFKNTR